MYPYTPYPLIPIGSFMGFILSLIPFTLHLSKQPLNTGIWIGALWFGIMNFVTFVDTIVWRNNVDIVIPVWCDIVSKLQVGADVGVPACDFILYLHLFRITRMRAVVPTEEKRKRRRALIFDLSLCLGLPVLVMILWSIVEPYRFRITEEIGCQLVATSFVTYVMVGSMNIFYLASAALSPLILHKLIRHRNEMNEVLSSHPDSDVTPNKCIRVMILASSIFLFYIPFLISSDILIGLRMRTGNDYIGATSTQSSPTGPNSKIILVTAQQWGSSKWDFFVLKGTEWYYVLEATFFFLVFGTTADARCRYRLVLSLILKKTGLSKKQVSVVVPDMVFGSSRPHRVRRGSLSFLESTVGSSGHSTVRVQLVKPIDNAALETDMGAVKRSEGGDAVDSSPSDSGSSSRIAIPGVGQVESFES